MFCCNSTFKLSSTFENGSSNKSKSGFDISDLASDTLWASPALIWWGYFSARPSKCRSLINSSVSKL